MVTSFIGEGGDSPAILQLRRWDPSQIQLNLSEFREAFISPTRELLLLLSYQYEALLLPLVAGNSTKRNNHLKGLQSPSFSDFCSTEQEASCISDSLDSIPCTSEPEKVTPDGSSRSEHYPVACDVKSLAWGHCGDSYNQHKGAIFKELLFVSGDRGVTVHAFRQPDKTSEMILPEDEVGQGRWVEWGPCAASLNNLQAKEQCGSNYESPRIFSEASKGNATDKTFQDVCIESGDNDLLSISSTSKKWLRTFLTEADTTESDGHFWTKFPEKQSFPCSAEIVSFNIVDSTSKFLEFLSRTKPVSDVKGNWIEETPLHPVADASVHSETSSLSLNANSLPRILSLGTNNSYKCSRVFASSSHRLVGLVLTITDPVLTDTSGRTARSREVLLVVTMIHHWGIQWICSVKLQQTCLNLDLEIEWTDFQFSSNLLFCLNVSGLIFIYGATTGAFVACLDVLQICGLKPKCKLSGQAKLPAEDNFTPGGADIQREPDKKVNSAIDHQIEGYSRGTRVFERLMVASDSSLLASVDKYGVIYLICVDDFISDNSYSLKEFLPHFGYGLLVGWEVGGSELGCQRVFSKLSHCHGLNSSLLKNKSFLFTDNREDIRLLDKKKCYIWRRVGQYGDYMSGFSAVSQIEDQGFPSSQLALSSMRRILIPNDVSNKYDSICFSPFGITRLIRRCNVNDKNGFKIVHSNLQVATAIQDDRVLDLQCTRSGLLGREEALVGEAIGCSFQGCFYLVTQDGLSIVLPSISVSSTILPVEYIGYWHPNIVTGNKYNLECLLAGNKEHWPPWKVEILDKVILYEGPEVADHICLVNGWDLKIARMRRLQLALDYLKSDEIEQSLEMLVDVNLAEEGILRLLFTAVFQIFSKVGSDSEIALPLRLLALATCFATKMVRKYGLLHHKKDQFLFQYMLGSRSHSLQSNLLDRNFTEIGDLRRLGEMAHFLEVIRNIQSRLGVKFRKSGRGLEDDESVLNPVDTNLLKDDSNLPMLTLDSVSSEIQNQHELPFPASDLSFENNEKLSLMPMGILGSSLHSNSGNFDELSVIVSQDGVQGRKLIPFENSKDMISRWEIANLDLKTVVKDALQSGRLPLAVLQLHIQRLRDLSTDEEPHDTFNEIRDVGRAIIYDLFLKGETGLAISTLQRLGEDIEGSLKQLLLGTIRRSLRMQVAEEMKRYGYLGPYELKTLERMSLIERLYPSSSFWRTFHGRQREGSKLSSSLTSSDGIKLHLICSHSSNNISIECGEIDGVVIGPWASNNEMSTFPVPDEDDTHTGYWAAAAVWSDAWDQRTIDRIVLDQPFLMGVHILWESQLEYYICHNDWDEVFKLLNMIPTALLSEGSLQVNLDGFHSDVTVGCTGELPEYEKYICSSEELDTVCLSVPNVKIFRFSASNICSIWLRMLIEQELAKKFIFLKEYWEGTVEIVPLLARAGFIINRSNSAMNEPFGSLSELSLTDTGGELHGDTFQALHKLVIHHCAQYDLPNLLDLYLDHHKLALDKGSLTSLLEAAGDCQWAKWLLLSRVKGCEYEASFSNARSIISSNVIPGRNLSMLEVDEIIRTVDDMAEGGGEMAALATLMYASSPIQNCLSSGSVNRNCNSSAQCTLENLRPALQRFPTLWRTLVASCFHQDADGSSMAHNTKNVFGNSTLSDYLYWRENIFSSTGRDTPLVQMLPCWFSKSIRRLIQLFVQGPLGWQSLAGIPAGESFLHREIGIFINAHESAGLSAISWEASIQKNVEEELYASSVEETGFGVEHHLHRGRALAAFNHLLGMRVQKLKSTNILQEQSGASANVQSDVQILLAPLTHNEESLLSSVVPLAIVHFEDSMLVASCAFLLELCGLSASMLRVDVAALRRISSFYMSSEYNEHSKHLSPKGTAFHAVNHEGAITISLAQALADDYLHHYNDSVIKPKETSNRDSSSKQPSRALMAVLLQLEKASLPLMVEGRTCGSWLLNGTGDGAEFRSQQKAASQHWNLVTDFCKMHQIPLSTKYLAVLAKDNDWVGFLAEAQVGGYPFDAIIQVASKEFSDPRLRIHILTVLKSIQSTRKKSSSYSNSAPMEKNNEMPFSTDTNLLIPLELFRLLAECEKEKNPGKALLIKAKDLRWSLLAMIASCFADVSPLSCLTVWLEITAARETSSIKVDDIASQIANNVGAAVEMTNLLPVGSRALTFRYNRRNPKRRRLMEQTSGDPSTTTSSKVSTDINVIRNSAIQDISAEEDKRQEADEQNIILSDSDEVHVSLSKMVAVLCEQHLFLPLLRAFEMFLPSCSLLPFIRALQAFSQMRLTEASAHLASFSARIKEEAPHVQTSIGREKLIGTSWISSTAVKAAEAMLSTSPSAYEKRCLLQLLAATDFGDGGSAATCFRRLYWKINLAEPSLRKDDDLYLGNETLDDASLLTALEKSGNWEQARNWARQLEASGAPWKSVVHHVTEAQAEAMVAEWKEYLWDVPEERAALWGHCQTLFLRYSYPPLQAGLFFLKHAEAVDKDIPAKELHELLLLSLQWLSGTITQSNPVYPLHLLREIETRVWLLAVESEAQVKSDGDVMLLNSGWNKVSGNSSNIIERTASIITKMDNHINAMRARAGEKSDTRENNHMHLRNLQAMDASSSMMTGGSTKTKRRAKSSLPPRRSLVDNADKNSDPDDNSYPPVSVRNNIEFVKSFQLQDENFGVEGSVSRWEERVGPAELERAVLSLLEFGQITAAKQLQHKLSPAHVPSEFALVDSALKLAATSTPSSCEPSTPMSDAEVLSVIQSYNIMTDCHQIEPLQVLENLTSKCNEGGGRGLCKRIIAVVKAANVLGLSFYEAFGKQPIELLQLLSLKAQDSLEEAKLLVQTHSMAPASIARILAESFLKGLLAAHRGGYMDSQKEEGPAPLLWRLSDFLKWAELCPSEPEIGHALMRLVITGQEIPHACEVELLILSHHFYKSSACLDGVDVLVALAATRVEAYVSEGDFSCLARLITGVGNFHALNFILGILIENGQLELLLQKYSATDTTTGTAETVRGFRMAVLTSLKHFNPSDLDAFAMVYNHFDMKHETASLLESRAMQSIQQWFHRYDKEQNEDLLDSMRYFIEAAEVHSTIDAGNKTCRSCAQASLISLQIRMPDFDWLNLSETNARRALVEQSRFQEALIVAEAYCLNQPSEWALVLWNQMLKPELTERFVAEFVAVLPLQPSMLIELARFYRAEVAARGDQSHFSVWLSPGGLPAEWAKHLGRSFRSLLKRTRDLRLRLQLATVATGFADVVDSCMKALDKVPETSGPLVLRKGHGGAYLPLM
ncbi:PREDICTED: uncharacterized protein LOC104599968 [Nelumbo nucifera]|uniref:Uncharacterized protein LOC104599968 n=1 Tax=Nelumbo nucifera TaxID=4432 RepID=A0A1U8Q4P9_NELNU|nr:PREDICTED: uncharacterized protein LOC104599968 [Nelumbo nucifera]XP_010261036.1 PREDICTED: uncharacterized protein LOC104599968 [Nelumbo nucifera]XP_019053774.1 PREDICTED: uncharacterized protein LOC104599968 [Nelumbo nucifera]